MHMHLMMESDPRIYVLGEDILDPYGGAFKVTKGLSTKFPERVLTTPISEAAVVGVANGLAMRGFLPIVEIMFGDFLTLCTDQLINHAAKFQWMYSNKVNVPIVVRTPMGGRRGYGPTHSQCLEKHFMGVPGLWIVAPNLVCDPGELLKKCVYELNSPTLFIENKTCYAKQMISDIPGMKIDTHFSDKSPFPVVIVKHEQEKTKRDGLIFCYGGLVSNCLEVVAHLKKEEGLYFDIAIITQISPMAVSHLEYICETYETNLHVYVEEASVKGGWSSEVIANIEDMNLHNQFRIKHLRIGSDFSPVPNSKELEYEALVQNEDIIEHILNCF